MIQQIFTVPIYEVDLEDIDNEAIYNFLKSEEQKHIGEEGSDEYNNYYKKELSILNKKEGGYHQEIFNKNLAQENNFSQQLFAREKGQFVLKNDNNETLNQTLKMFGNEIEKHCSIFAGSFINKERQEIDNMWFNINKYKDSIKRHSHPMAMISGVYYVKAPENCGSITFIHPATDVLSYYNTPIRHSEWNQYNAETWWKPAVEKRLYLFPSWLNHYVDPNLNQKERISISFNTIEAGFN